MIRYIFLRYVQLLIINHASKFCKVIIVINSFALIAVITLIYIYYHFANASTTINDQTPKIIYDIFVL